MRENEANVRKALERAGEQQIDCRARGVERVFDHKTRPWQIERLARWMQAGMDVHHRVAALEIAQQRIERGVAEKFLAVACEQRNALEAQCFKAITRFRDRRVD